MKDRALVLVYLWGPFVPQPRPPDRAGQDVFEEQDQRVRYVSDPRYPINREIQWSEKERGDCPFLQVVHWYNEWLPNALRKSPHLEIFQHGKELIFAQALGPLLQTTVRWLIPEQFGLVLEHPKRA